MSRCKKDDELYGPLHASSDGENTLCGQSSDENWWIVTNGFDGVVTCKKCIKINSAVDTKKGLGW
jgi:hypothetical protein